MQVQFVHVLVFDTLTITCTVASISLVYLVSHTGNFVSKFKVRSLAFNCYLGEPLGIVAIDYKTILVSDSEKSCVHVFDDEGKYQGKFGDTEMKTRQPAGELPWQKFKGHVIIT